MTIIVSAWTRPTSVREEIRQTRPFRSPAQEALVALARAADVVHRFLEQSLAAHDLTVQQYNVLRILRGAGPAGLPTLEIGERLIQPTPGITRLIDRLEKKGLVERERLASDRRCVLCTLTPAGLGSVNGLDDLVDRRDEEALQGLDTAQTMELIALLDRVRAGLPR